MKPLKKNIGVVGHKIRKMNMREENGIWKECWKMCGKKTRDEKVAGEGRDSARLGKGHGSKRKQSLVTHMCEDAAMRLITLYTNLTVKTDQGLER